MQEVELCKRGEENGNSEHCFDPLNPSIFKKHFPFEMNITHQCMHFMSPLPHLAHKGHAPYLFQADKTHFQFPRSLWPACSVQQNNGCPWKMVDDNKTVQVQVWKLCRLRENCPPPHISNYSVTQESVLLFILWSPSLLQKQGILNSNNSLWSLWMALV